MSKLASGISDQPSGSVKFLYFLIGISLPLAGVLLFSRNAAKKGHVDRAVDVTVEDSFPASDPPSSW